MLKRVVALSAACCALAAARPAPAADAAAIDRRVHAVLERMQGRWHDMNVPEADGRILRDIILKKGYTRALEVGTSTGRSTIWIAWALSKTGGKLITLEIDEARQRQALTLIAEAGLSAFVDARLGDAHELVPALPGPFDFVFIDADKGWYSNYARALLPKLTPGGCMTAHNVRGSGGGYWGTGEYFDLMTSLPEFETSIHPDSVNGVCVSYRKRPGVR
jgi:predicted O-methyltransferase YrrM